MNRRFTLDGSPELERQLEDLCAVIGESVRSVIPPHRLEGLVLAGGYGRGEGGVLKREDGGDAPYNDLEFFVFVRGNPTLNSRRFSRVLHELGERLSPEAGLDVEFKVESLASLRASQPTMFFYDLVMGHRWIIGDDSMFAGCEHHRDAGAVPLHEATRLLFNRSSGLLFAHERLQRGSFTEEDADFVGRNLAQAKLAMGDVFLAAEGRYNWSCRERNAALASRNLPAWAERLKAWHGEGVEFKLHPNRTRSTRAQLMEQCESITAVAGDLFLWLESRRLGTDFDSHDSYLRHCGNLCPEVPGWKRAVLDARHFGLAGAWRCRYPREALLRALTALLWLRDPKAAAWVLGCAEARTSAAYARLWNRFN